MVQKEERVTYLDPPSGWRFGFPKPLPPGTTDVRQWLLDEGYPEKDVDFGMKWMREWDESKY